MNAIDQTLNMKVFHSLNFKVESKNQSKLQKVLGYLSNGSDNDDGSFDFSFAGLFRCIFCTHKKVDSVGIQLSSIAVSMADMNDKLKRLESKFAQTQDSSGVHQIDDDNDDDCESENGLEDVPLISDENELRKNLLSDWLYDPDLKDGETDTISAAEEQFWVDLIEKYLTPIEMTPKDKEHVQNQLRSLRDISVFAFSMGNALFVLINLLLQLNKEYLQMKWPLNIKNNIIFDGSTMEIKIERDYLHLEPISLLFVAFFGIVLFVQFIAMLFHRFATISQILATTTIDWYCGRKVKETVSSSELKEKSVKIARFLQKPKPEWREDDDDEDDDNDGVKRKIKKDTLHRLLMQHKKKKDWSNLETNFKRELFKEGDLKLKKLTLSKRTESILDEMRKSMAEYRRVKKSTSNYLGPYYFNSEGGYSHVQSVESTADSFSIYQQTTYETSTPEHSIYVDGTRLKSALKRPRSQAKLNIHDEINLYGSVGISNYDNYAFEDDKSEIQHSQIEEVAKNDTSI